MLVFALIFGFVLFVLNCRFQFRLERVRFDCYCRVDSRFHFDLRADICVDFRFHLDFSMNFAF